MNRVMFFPGFKLKTLTFSYDDGVGQDIRLVKILSEHGLKGTFNINSGLAEKNDCEYAPDVVLPRMSLKQAIKLYEDNGMEVAVHAYTHPHLEDITPTELTYEILKDKDTIEQITGKPCRGMAYPYGSYNDGVVEAVKACGILYSRTTAARNNFEIPDDWLTLSATCHHKNPELMSLADNFVNSTVYGPKMFYLWGHSYEFQIYGDKWSIIENFADYVANKPDIWYATNIEIFEYIEAFKRLITTADSHIVYNPTAVTLYFGQAGKQFRLAPGETLRI